MSTKQTEALKLARDFISAEWGFGGTTDIEPSKIVRMLEEALVEQPAQWSIPQTPEQIRDFIGSDYVWRQRRASDVAPHEDDQYCVTAHDLISAFDRLIDHCEDNLNMVEQPVVNQRLTTEPTEFLSGFLTERLAIERGIEWTPAIHDLCNRAIEEEKLAEQPAQQQEPVLWQILNGVCHAGVRSTENLAREAAAGMQKAHDLGGSLAAFHVRSLYTSPPASKPWVSLTDEDIEKLSVESGKATFLNDDEQTGILWFDGDCMSLARAIEAKLREKNA